MDPLSLGVFAWQASLVFVLRSAELAFDPMTASSRLADMMAEKHTAFTAGWLDAALAVAAGARPDQVMAAAMAPSRHRVAANALTLARG